MVWVLVAVVVVVGVVVPVLVAVVVALLVGVDVAHPNPAVGRPTGFGRSIWFSTRLPPQIRQIANHQHG